MAKQLHNVVVSRSGKKVGRGSGLQEVSFLQHRDTVAELQRLIDVVGDHDHGFPEALLKAEELTLEFVTSDRVECAKRFIEQDDLRVGCKRPCKGHALSLSAGQFNGIPRSKPCRIKINEVQDCMHPARSSFGLPSQ